MCLGIPCLVVEVPEKQWAIIEAGGIRRKIGLHLVGDVPVGEYVMVHAGYAVEKLDLAEAEERIKLWEELLRFESAGKTE
ncbi:hydrogenase expression/formation protein HypC [Desulfotomaculum arcticum]|uniref:Hydrogenase expression/formation protein HypC n=1 Tax=Desulfotruncus arcticus DSM 17038 TaxID=1121424 RepID=A0A1I2TWG7_9FIRM|nr:HypC/HybG/HupF family hydrogenase formation chaperone [Desulfotruncus arcticus]SFG69184.1 hydrogenase expression/formation protein HypC [Desulfotomaculum arcticum] [Desulfotruncus arcticus DSM 17038]